jgi:glyoxylase-like metal-dependent hydrolase (beta-lactamase superfamily II)
MLVAPMARLRSNDGVTPPREEFIVLHRLVTWLIPLLLASGAATGATAQAELKLFVFDCGVIRFDDVASFGLSNDETPVRELFVPCYLIEHGEGADTRRLLFDAGLPPDIAGQGEVEPEPGMRLVYARSLEDQLADLDLVPTDVDLVAFSHLHFDHVGSANLFAASTLLIQAPDFEAGFDDPDPRLFPMPLYAALKESARVLLNGDHDVFGDGRVRLISAPGQTPGHQTLLLDLEETGRVLLSGDLYHFRESRTLRRVPVFNSDAEQTLASMTRIESLLVAEDATLWIEHDKAFADTLRKAPAFHR